MAVDNYVLIVKGKKNLTFKTAHRNYDYLNRIGNALITQDRTNYEKYDIQRADDPSFAVTSPFCAPF